MTGTLKILKVSNDCMVMKYIGNMSMPFSKKRAIDIALEKKKKYQWGLFYKNKKNIFVKIGKSIFRVKMKENISTLDLKLGLNYILNHNGTEGLNLLCFSERCPSKNTSKCTMRLLRKFY